MYIPTYVQRGHDPSKFRKYIWCLETRWMRLPHARESIMLSRFDTTPQRDRRTELLYQYRALQMLLVKFHIF